MTTQRNNPEMIKEILLIPFLETIYPRTTYKMSPAFDNQYGHSIGKNKWFICVGSNPMFIKRPGLVGAVL